MKKQKTWTIYCHINKINNKRYIGQTCKTNLNERWQHGNGYTKNNQPIFAAAIQKYGWDNFEHIILEADILDKNTANIRERYWIAFYHTYIYDSECNGYNMQPGGGGLGPECYTIELKEKLGLGMRGKHHSLETKQKLSKARKGRKFTAEHRKHMSESCTIKKAIICIETQQVFESIKMANNYFNTDSNTRSIYTCLSGQIKTAYGYHWAYVEDTVTQNKLKSFIGQEPHYYNKKRKVLCVETTEVFESVRAAVRKYGMVVSDCLNGRCLTAAGKHWKYLN